MAIVASGMDNEKSSGHMRVGGGESSSKKKFAFQRTRGLRRPRKGKGFPVPADDGCTHVARVRTTIPSIC